MIICSNFENTMNKVLRWLLLAIPFIPLLFLGKTLYPQITPKVIVFRIIVELATILFLLLWVNGYGSFGWSILRSKKTWLPALILLVGVISSLLGVDFYHSFWSGFLRLDGLFTWIPLVFYFYLLLLVFK